MYLYEHIRTHTHIYTHTYTHIHIYIYIDTCVCIHRYIYVYMYIYVCVYMCVCVCTIAYVGVDALSSFSGSWLGRSGVSSSQPQTPKRCQFARGWIWCMSLSIYVHRHECQAPGCWAIPPKGSRWARNFQARSGRGGRETSGVLSQELAPSSGLQGVQVSFLHSSAAETTF